jgi:hypothetical protein
MALSHMYCLWMLTLKWLRDVIVGIQFGEINAKQLLGSLYYTGYTQKNGAVSKVNTKFISHLTRAQHTP